MGDLDSKIEVQSDEQVELDVLSSARDIGSENLKGGRNIISIALPES